MVCASLCHLDISGAHGASACAKLILLSPQDTNTLEYEILKLLQGAGSQLFVVGDPDQAIYSWRGAITEHLDARFKADFGHCTAHHKLEHNHR